METKQRTTVPAPACRLASGDGGQQPQAKCDIAVQGPSPRPSLRSVTFPAEDQAAVDASWQQFLRRSERRTKELLDLLRVQDQELKQFRHVITERGACTGGPGELECPSGVEAEQQDLWQLAAPDVGAYHSSHDDSLVSVKEALLLSEATESKEMATRFRKKVQRAATFQQPDMLPQWKSETDFSFSKENSRTPTGRSSVIYTGGPGGLQVMGGSRSAIVFPPGCPSRNIWDLASTLFIGYDLFSLPLVAFGFGQHPFCLAVVRLSTVFWTLDLIFSFFLGYLRKDGHIELRWSHVVRCYLSTWFPLDLTIVLLDWCFLIVGSLSDEVLSAGRLNKTSRFVRLAKVFRFLRLGRLFRLARVYDSFIQRVIPAQMVTAVHSLKVLSCLSVFVHYIACGWFAIGMHMAEIGTSWSTRYIQEDISNVYFYIICFHWTLAQFLPAPCADHSANAYERAYNVFVLFVGFSMFSTMIASVTALITQGRNEIFRRLRENDLMRKFVEDNQVSSILAMRIGHFTSQSRKKTITSEADVPAIQTLPVSMQKDIHYEVNLQRLVRLTFFRMLDISWQSAVRELCHSSMAEGVFFKDDQLFQFGSLGTSVRVVVLGCLLYEPLGRSEHVDGESEMVSDGIESSSPGKRVRIEPQGCLSEIVLWASWVHRGEASACETSMVLLIDREDFSAAVKRNPVVHPSCVEYATLFLSGLQEAYWQGIQVDDTFQACSSDAPLDSAQFSL